jgi:hypothetical protein
MKDEYDIAILVFIALIFLLYMAISSSLPKKNKSRE